MAWTSGEAWFDSVMDALRSSQGEQKRRAAKVAAGTFLRVARDEWLSADVATGRGVATAHETVAARLGMCSKTVQRARALMEALGFAVTIAEGRYLTTAERDAARAAHGGHQVRAASLRALTLPRPAAVVENVHLPRRGSVLDLSLVKEFQPTRASAREAAAPRPQARTTRTGQTRHDGSRSPRPIELQRFAGKLVARMPWLARGRHVGAVCSMLDRAGVDPARWTVGALLDAIARANVDAGILVPDAAAQRDPIGYLAWSIGRAVDHAEPTPIEVARATAERRRAEREARAQERAALPPRSPDEVARIEQIIEQMKLDAAARRRARAHETGHRMPPQPVPVATAAVVELSPVARITEAILGAGRRRQDATGEGRDRVDFALRLHGLLLWRGWTLTAQLDSEMVSWTWEPSRCDDVPDDHEPATIAALDVESMTINVTRAGESVEVADRLDWRGLELAIEDLETHRIAE